MIHLTATRWLLCAICFASGALTLVIEIAGNRLLAPWFGNSVYTWTALIGVVLVAISVGDYVGGFLVDRAPRTSFLGYLLLAAAAWTLLIPWIHTLLAETAADAGIVSGPLLAAVVLFAVPACLLAAVSPFVIRLLSRTTGDHAIGLSAGLVGMLSTLGSFVGTFATGFYLIPHVGVRTLFLATGVVTALLGGFVIAWCREWRPLPVAAMLATVCAAAGMSWHSPPPPAGVIHEEESFYHELRVEETTSDLGERVRLLKLDTTLEGAQYVSTGGMFMPCNLYWRLAEALVPRLERCLFLGGGGFAMPEDCSRRHAAAAVDVVEIDPAVIAVGRRFFRLDEFPRVRPIVGDARHFLRRSPATYDLIFCDAFQGMRNIPAHLVTREFFTLVKERLAEEGVFMANLISPVTGPRADVFRSILATIKTQFAHVDVYAVNPQSLDRPGNVIVVAANRELSAGAASDDPLVRHLASTRVAAEAYEPLDAPVLTDDKNPIEHFVAEQLLATE